MLVRVGLGLNKDTRPKWLESWLSEKGLMLFLLKPETFMQTIFREPMDLLIISEGFFSGAGEKTIRKIAANPEGPLVLVLTDPDRGDSGAAFLAAGVEVVIPLSVEDSVIKETIENLLQKRLEYNSSRIRSGFHEAKIEDFVSESEVSQTFLRVARKVVPSNSSLLILGETGVGKERLAQAIHREGPRSRGPFIPINCAALPENLLESELFGHEQGAFTGAVRARRGAFELAHRGTIFLDEIGDMPLHLQTKLLRVLQDKEFQKIGGEKRIQVDVRIVAATNHDLQQAVDAGRFRRDLYYRLSVVSLLIPPLRERPNDVAILANRLVNELPPRSLHRRSIDEPSLEAMKAYDWPGNVRELMNVLERAILLGDGQNIRIEDLPSEIAAERKRTPIDPGSVTENFGLVKAAAMSWKQARIEFVARFEKSYFEELMRSCRGRIGEAARRAEITPRALHQKLTRHGINKEEFKV